MAIGILLILSSTSHNHTKIVNKYLTSLVKQLQNCNDKVLGKLLSLVGKLTDEKGDK